jgi:two-component system sensor histidine kinase TctE
MSAPAADTAAAILGKRRWPELLRAWLAPAVSRRGEARSLFGEILDWMFAPLLLLWPMSVSLTYLVAQSIANTPYDHALIERAQALAARVQFEGPQARFDLSPGLLEIYGDGRTEPGAYAVMDAAGRVLAGDPDLHRPSADHRQEKFELRQDSLRGHPVRVAYAWVLPPRDSAAPAVLVEAADPPEARTQLANDIVKGVILPQFVVLPLALALVWFGLTRGLAPLARLQRTIRDRSAQDLSLIDTTAAPEELAPLMASFNDLLARMAQALHLQQRFIADAAHQMKTPLAGLRTQAELALRQPDAQELQRSLQQIADSTQSATRLVNQLLALARAEHGHSGAAATSLIDVPDLARHVVQDWVAQAIAQGIDLGYEADIVVRPALIMGAPTLLREMLNNLVDNALRYSSVATESPSSPTVTVRVKGSQDDVTLEIEDNGPGIPAAERTMVFERFYRVLGTGREGSGLGLPIVREICAQHHADLELLDAAPGASRPGCLFRIRFPRAHRAHATHTTPARP